MKNKIVRGFSAKLSLFVAALMAVLCMGSSAHATVLSDLQTAVTTNLGLIITSVGVILVAALALPIARKVYSVIKSAITGA